MCIVYKRVSIYTLYGGCSKLWYPKTVLTPPFRKPCALFRAAAKSIHRIMIMFSFVYFV